MKTLKVLKLKNKMSKLPLRSLFGIILEKRSSFRFLIGTIGSFSFSIAVILSTIGLMDGFEFTLKKALSHSSGDIKFISKDSFFKSTDLIKDELDLDFISGFTSVLQVEAFALANEESKGVLLKGIEKETFLNITGLKVDPLSEGIIIGSQFQKIYNLKVGDTIVLAFASGRSKDQGAAILEEVRIDGVVEHGVYEKDLRFIYINKAKLERILNYKEGTANLGLIKLKNLTHMDKAISSLKSKLNDKYRFDPYWSEFEVLLDAVKIEKVSISLILQLIVIVAILNIAGFIIYLSETKSQDFFMLRALGLNLKAFQRFWIYLLSFIWSLSCLISLVFVYIFENVLLQLPFLKIPGEIYVLSELEVVLDNFDYLYVFGISFAWILIIGYFTMRKMKSKSLVAGLRQEFS